jgi:hypothetical protein
MAPSIRPHSIQRPTTAERPPAFTSDAMSISDAARTGANFAVSEPGIYLWVVVYQGDDCNAPTTTECGSERDGNQGGQLEPPASD